MSATGWLKAGAPKPLIWPGRVLAHFKLWIATLCRPVRAAPSRSGTLALIVCGSAVVAAIAATMVLVDGWAIAQARELPAWLIAVFLRISDFGRSGWFLWPIGLLLLALAALMRPAIGRMANLVAATIAVRLGFIFLAIGIPGLVVAIVKRLIGRVRPSDLGPFHYVLFAWRPDYASLPSGHSTAAFAAAVAVGAVWPRARPAMWIYAVLVAASRVLITAHYPSDVLVGAFVGISSALLIRRWFAERRLGFSVDARAGVRALPGPSRRRVARLVAKLLGVDSWTRP
ncbi:MAG TPA: phosphatase PAP2 family protein [Xanthobacteraceae bacterium]|nr:phosphatase PAP2 family protein [Xanthobacteraceae bacterium]